MGKPGSICSFSSLITLGLSAFFLWYGLKVSKPKCSLQKFYIPSLNQTLNTTQNPTILFFQLKLQNPNQLKGIYYDDVNVTFLYRPTNNLSLGTFSIPGFYQGHKKKALKDGEMNVSRLDREEVFGAVSNGSAVFRVDLATAVRYKAFLWKTKRHRINVGADLNISSDQNYDIRLTSNSPKTKIPFILFLFFWFCCFNIVL
ncbi:Late embryogenesis abundant (LEA) hydroxyproline-rich glycoprotein family [Euphorbia peplus]|nr:Late embryogenesis abundant (LEA) hydroxyproline-rich glycoprotein family [Euphorbia peplus]